MPIRTAHLVLSVPVLNDAAAHYAVDSDPRVWTHFPSLRSTEPQRSREWVRTQQRAFAADGLGVWSARESATGEFVGWGGCSQRDDAFWNLGFRFAPDAHGRGYATELAFAALDEARRVRPDLPIVAYLLEHNRASAAVARKVGLTLCHRGPDTGNPDPDAIRLVFSDRALSDTQLAATLR